jgi:hypothetical protein
MQNGYYLRSNYLVFSIIRDWESWSLKWSMEEDLEGSLMSSKRSGGETKIRHCIQEPTQRQGLI